MDNRFADNESTDAGEGTVAWQLEEMGRWSKLHETTDFGRTTRCGMTVPESFNTDSWSQMGRCKACLRARKGER